MIEIKSEYSRKEYIATTEKTRDIVKTINLDCKDFKFLDYYKSQLVIILIILSLIAFFNEQHRQFCLSIYILLIVLLLILNGRNQSYVNRIKKAGLKIIDADITRNMNQDQDSIITQKIEINEKGVIVLKDGKKATFVNNVKVFRTLYIDGDAYHFISVTNGFFPVLRILTLRQDYIDESDNEVSKKAIDYIILKAQPHIRRRKENH